MVGEQVAQFSFSPVPGERRTLVSLGLVGDGYSLSEVASENALPTVTAHMVDIMSTFGTHTESCEVLNGEEK